MSKRQVPFDDLDDAALRARLAPLAETVLPAAPRPPRAVGTAQTTRAGLRWPKLLAAAAAGAFLSAAIGAACIYLLAQRPTAAVPATTPVVTRHNTLAIQLPPVPGLAIETEPPGPQGTAEPPAVPDVAAPGTAAVGSAGTGARVKAPSDASARGMSIHGTAEPGGTLAAGEETRGEQTLARAVPVLQPSATAIPAVHRAAQAAAHVAPPVPAAAGAIQPSAATPDHAAANNAGKAAPGGPLLVQVEPAALPDAGAKQAPSVTTRMVAPAVAKHSENPPAPKHRAAEAAIRPEANRASRVTLSAALLHTLLRRGDAELSIGDIAAAQMLYERAAEGGSAEAARDLATTYDAAFLQKIGARGVEPDEALAASWRHRADELDAMREKSTLPVTAHGHGP